MGVKMGKISKAIKLKLQELRIDNIFKEKILKYKKEDTDNDSISENNQNDKEIEDNLEKIQLEQNHLNDENKSEESNNEENKILNNNLEGTKKTSKDICINKTMMQYFEWYYPSDGSLWNKVKENAKELEEVGITALWLPPAYKGNEGMYDVGYGAYDLYDLGEFNQKGSVRTKYGTKEEYLSAIEEAHKYNIKIYGDVVFNHKAGADEAEIVSARPVASYNRNEFIGDKRDIEAHTIFNFPDRGEKYSKYKWSAKDFDGVDFDNITKEHGIFKFENKEWEQDVDNENGNYDFLMFADLDMDSQDVVNELKSWGEWYLKQTDVDGFRLDAIKHIRFDFFKEWLESTRKNNDKELFAVGEYWTHDVNKLKYYLDKSENCMSLFDVPLHFNFYNASNSFGNFDMRTLVDNTLLKANPDKTVTFVDNHDTQLGQSLESWVQPWFKLLAYTFILTRKEGCPCVFYGDYYGIPEKSFNGLKEKLDIILNIRKNYAYGVQNDYIDNSSIIGWTREGDDDHIESGLASIITVNYGGLKRMYVGSCHRGEIWVDATKQLEDRVVIDESGYADFRVLDGSYSIWIKETNR
jgi:alpha-amylase